MQTFETLADLKAYVGREIGTTPYLNISQEMVNDFAKATSDFQWIHVDVEKAKKYSPFKTPIAHGFLTLSLAPQFMADLFKVKSAKMGVNYGANKIRFTAAVPVGSNIRMKGVLKELNSIPKGVRLVMTCTFEIEGQTKPACIAELISLFYE